MIRIARFGTSAEAVELGGARGRTRLGAAFNPPATTTSWMWIDDDPSKIMYALYGLSGTLTAVPEPNTFCLGLLGLGLAGWKKRKQRQRVSANHF